MATGIGTGVTSALILRVPRLLSETIEYLHGNPISPCGKVIKSSLETTS